MKTFLIRISILDVDNEIIMKLISIFFQYCSIQVFEPLDIYDKCKDFMTSMRNSDKQEQVISLIKCLNDILINPSTKKEIKMILLKEHLSHLLELTTNNTNNNTNNSILLTESNIRLITSLLDLLESMIDLMKTNKIDKKEEEKEEGAELTQEEETLTIFIHILSVYLIDKTTMMSKYKKQIDRNRISDLNDLVLAKLINLGKNHTVLFKQILNKWPNIKSKIETAIKSSSTSTSTSNDQTSKLTNTNNSVTLTQPNSSLKDDDNIKSSSSSESIKKITPTPTPTPTATSTSTSTKAPKIQLKNFSGFK
jgi:hypothetical protein